MKGWNSWIQKDINTVEKLILGNSSNLNVCLFCKIQILKYISP